MNLRVFTFSVLFLIALSSFSATTTLVHPSHSAWKYLAPDSDPGFGLSWIHLDFDDSGWTSVIMPLGYPVTESVGFNDLSLGAAGGTVIPERGLVTYYFRHNLDWQGPSSEVRIFATNWVDDGVALFINGLEVYRLAMNPGELTHLTPPGIEHGDVSTRPLGELAIGRAFLTNGANIIAATVRNNNEVSSDLVWAVHLNAVIAGPVSFITHPQDTNVVEGQTIRLSASPDDPLTSLQWYHDMSPLLNATNATLEIVGAGPDNTGNYFVTASNSFNSTTSLTAQVEVAPLEITSPLSNQVSVVRGGPLRISITANWPANYVWFFNGSPIDQEFNPSAGTSTLEVEETSQEHDGLYMVMIMNPFRQMEAYYDVEIYFHGEPPRILSARTDHERQFISIKFDEPVLGDVTNTQTYALRRSRDLHPVEILAAVINEEGDTITLQTAGLEANTRYALSFNSPITDMFGQPIPENTSTIIEFPFMLLARNAAWRFYATGTNEPPGWKEPGFDDSAWERGAGPIGHELNALPWPLNTSFSTYSSSRLTYHFRTEINYFGPSNAIWLLEELIDDAVIFYLDGVEISRTRFSVIPCFVCMGNSSVMDANLELKEITLNLAPGPHLLAAEVHQVGEGSSDIVFGAEITSYYQPEEVGPRLHWTHSGSAITFHWYGAHLQLQSSDTLMENDWNTVSNSASAGTTIDTSTAARFYRLISAP